jgi:hypothetical protein
MVGAATGAQSAFVTGNELYKLCSTRGQEDACVIYVMGASDMLDVQQAGSTKVCVPSVGVTGNQMRDVVVKWLGAHPEQRHASAASLIWLVLKESWPCR